MPLLLQRAFAFKKVGSACIAGKRQSLPPPRSPTHSITFRTTPPRLASIINFLIDGIPEIAAFDAFDGIGVLENGR